MVELAAYMRIGGNFAMWEKQVGERVKALRKERNLSRSQFGRLIGVSEQYVGKIERGSHSITGVVIANICKITGVSADYIMFGVEDPLEVTAALNGLSREQIGIGFDMLKRLATLVNTENGNNALIQEVLFQQHAGIA